MTLHSRLAAERATTEIGRTAVSAAMTYLAPMRERPYNFTFEPPAGGERTNATYVPHTVAIEDVRPIAGSFSVDRGGFALRRHESAVRDFYDEDEVRRVYYPEAERLVAEATGAARVVVFDHTIRKRVPGLEDRRKPGPRQPVPRVHVDYTETSGPQRVRDLMGDDAPLLLRRRFAIVNIWRPIRGPLRDAPLAVCDAGSLSAHDLVAVDQIYPDRTGEIYYVTYDPAHRWYYAPAMERDEVLLLKCYDSLRTGVARFAPHAAFEDPTTPADVLPRESIELRTLVFYPN